MIARVGIALCLLRAVIWYINSYLFRSILHQRETSQLDCILTKRRDKQVSIRWRFVRC